MRQIWGITFLLVSGFAMAADADLDGIDDAWELSYGLNPADPTDAALDKDKDGLTASQEANICGSNPNRRDTDGDWLADNTECLVHGTNAALADTDSDGINDFLELMHGFNPLNPLSGGGDADNDQLSDYAEITLHKTNPNKSDTDGDWLKDGSEVNYFGTNPLKSDTDGDNVNDFVELANGYNPLDPNDIDGLSDSDGDGLLAKDELQRGTDPDLYDTDDDKLGDGWEVANGLNPTNYADGAADSDGDGFTVYEEFRLGSDHTDPNSTPAMLAADFAHNFAAPYNLPYLFQLEGTVDGVPWSRNCNIQGEGLSPCAFVSGAGDDSTVRFMANFPNGKFSFAWAAGTPNNFTITVDGEELVNFSGFTLWQQVELDFAQGVHEVIFSVDSGKSGWQLVAIDSLKFEANNEWPRPSNESCFAPPAEEASGEVELVQVFEELPPFSKATLMIQAPVDGSRWYVLEQDGLLKVFDVANPAGVRTWLDFTGQVQSIQEGGLLSLAFDPNFPTVPEVYVVYTSVANYTTLSRIILDDVDMPVAPVEQILLTLKKDKTGHYGGDIAFGSDGMLYMSAGEDTRAERAQQTTNLFGSMLRIDVLGVAWPAPGYNIPAGNAFPATNAKCGPTKDNAAACPEIWAWGLRNPWRWSFDPVTDDLWLGDVGESTREEVDLIVAGGNYGWPCYEGSIPGPRFATCTDTAGMMPPAADYTHDEGRAVMGGFVYRGSALPERYGRYIFSDLGRGPIWELLPNGFGGYVKSQIGEVPGIYAASGLDVNGEMYFVAYYDPAVGGYIRPPILKLVPGAGTAEQVEMIPDDLAATGCFNALDPRLPGPALIPYTVNSPLWSDGAEKERFMALPNSTTIDIDGIDDWHFPIGSVLVKNFYLEGKIIETRLLMNRLQVALGSGRWDGFTYEWNEDETVATRVKGGKTTLIDGQLWTYPSETQCGVCHTDAAGTLLGPETAQLNGFYHYPFTSGPANQLGELDRIGMFTSPLPDPAVLPALADPLDESADLDERARAYLHSNCANCHQPGTGVPSTMDLRYFTLLSNTNVCDVAPERGNLGLGSEARLVAPGEPDNSIVLERMSRRDSQGMPPLGTHLVDDDGVDLIENWIEGLQSCQ